MSNFRYVIYGVCFECDIALELPEASIDHEPRFALRRVSGPWPASRMGPSVEDERDDWTALRLYADGSVEIEWRGWLSFWIDPRGVSVRYQVCENQYPTAFEAYVANFAISACLLLQGEEFLHSTVVYYRGTGMGFLGPSGAGKSTITAHLLGLGGELVSDDMLRITGRRGKLYAEAGPPRLKLFEETARVHLLDRANSGRWNPVSEKYLFDIETPAISRPRRPLDVLILLAPPPDDADADIRLTRLQGLEAFQALTSSTMNSRLQTKDRLARQFAFASRLAGQIPIYALHYPRRHDRLPEVMGALASLLEWER